MTVTETVTTGTDYDPDEPVPTAVAAERAGVLPSSVAAWVGCGAVPVAGVEQRRDRRGTLRPVTLVTTAAVFAYVRGPTIKPCACCGTPFSKTVHGRFCYRCKVNPERRAHLRGTSKYAPLRALDNWAGANPNVPAADPTPHPPGSADKIKVMAARAAARTALFHPLDADFGGVVGVA